MMTSECLMALPLPVILVEDKTGLILYSNAAAEYHGLVTGQTYFARPQDSAAALYASGRAVAVIAGGKPLLASVRETALRCDGKEARAIAFMELRAETDMPAESEICALLMEPDGKRREAEFLRMTGLGAGAFCAALYEARSQRYVLRDEWRSRRSPSIPVLAPDFMAQTGAESLRMQKIKGAAEIAIFPYDKSFGSRGAAVYFFDQAADADKQETLRRFVSLYGAFAPDTPDASRFALHRGIGALEQGVAVWTRATRTLLYSNAAYRRMFGRGSGRTLSGQLGNGIRGSVSHEALSDGHGRCYDVTHTVCGNRGDGVVSTIIIDNTAYVKAQRRLDAMARTDALTGLMNRRAGLEYLERMYAQCKRQGQPLTVCFADIDGLKYINDTWGHGAGDAMIRSVAGVLKKYMERAGAVCRLGGDEFVLILPAQTAAQATLLSAQISRDAARCFVGDSDGIAMSFGIKQAEFTAGESAQTLVSVADMEMYREKNSKIR